MVASMVVFSKLPQKCKKLPFSDKNGSAFGSSKKYCSGNVKVDTKQRKVYDRKNRRVAKKQITN